MAGRWEDPGDRGAVLEDPGAAAVALLVMFGLLLLAGLAELLP